MSIIDKIKENELEILQKRVQDKIWNDYTAYRTKTLYDSKENILNNSYSHAVVSEWMCFFENCFEGNYDENENVLEMLLAMDNIFDQLLEVAAQQESIEFNNSGFANMFEQLLEERGIDVYE